MHNLNRQKSVIINGLFIISLIAMLSSIGFSATDMGNVSIVSVPSGAYVFTDAHPLTVWSTPTKLPLPAGQHSIRLEKIGYLPYNAVVGIKGGNTSFLSVNLVPGPTGNLTLYTFPSGAIVNVYSQGKYDSAFRISNFKNLVLNAGSYVAKISKDGYENHEVAFNITGSHHTALQVGLKPLQFGNLSAISTPSGANVYINDKYSGVTPYEGTYAAGNYSVKLELAGYEPKFYPKVVVVSGRLSRVYAVFSDVTTTTMPSGNSSNTTTTTISTTTTIPSNVTTTTIPNITTTTITTTTTTMPSVSAYGNITIDVSPRVVYVYLDGSVSEYSIAPLTITRVAPGMHSLMLDKPGYLTEFMTVTVPDGKTAIVNLTLKPLPPYKGNMTITSNPSGGFVLIDRAYRGVTPLVVNDLVIGNYTVSVGKVGYLARQFREEVLPGKTTSVAAYLSLIVPTSNNGSLMVLTNPDKASVYINDTYIGTSPLNVSLESKNYTLRLQKTGYKNETRIVEVITSKNVTVSVNLTPSVRAGTEQFPTRSYIDNINSIIRMIFG
ncbi:MAG: PEGA domain-containing protein [Candidatus Aenigmarchaeota archaeon]|nr:PEGA domain-containing protein [Candidatus Aenigmarchaeota archaeon]